MLLRREVVELDPAAVLGVAEQEREEIAIIQSYMPKQLGEDEVKAAIAAVIKETGAASVKDMGKVMAALKAKYSGQIDFAKAGAVVKSLLGASS